MVTVTRTRGNITSPDHPLTHPSVCFLEPQVKLGRNVRAVPDLEQACRDASVLVFVMPHQFLTPRGSPLLASALAQLSVCVHVCMDVCVGVGAAEGTRASPLVYGATA